MVKKNKFIKIFFIICTAIFSEACSFSINPHDFNSDTLDNLHIAFYPKKSVTIKPHLIGAKDRKNHVPAGNIVVNDDEFTKVLVEKIKTAIGDQGSKTNNTNKIITIQVSRVEIQPLLTMSCVIDYNLKLGSDDFYGFQVRASNWNYITACESAFTNAATAIINNRKLIKYIDRN